MTPDERGVTESVQWAVLAPVLLGVLIVSLQAGLVWHARNVALHAAAAGAEAGAARSARPGDAERAARSIVATGGLADPGVTVTVEAAVVRVRVTGRAPVLLAVGPTTVDETSVAARERTR